MKLEDNGHLHPEKYYTNSEELALIYGCNPDIFDLAYQGRPENVLIDQKEAAKYLDISARTFRYKMMTGRIKPVVKHNRIVRFTRKYLDDLKESINE